MINMKTSQLDPLAAGRMLGRHPPVHVRASRWTTFAPTENPVARAGKYNVWIHIGNRGTIGVARKNLLHEGGFVVGKMEMSVQFNQLDPRAPLR